MIRPTNKYTMKLLQTKEQFESTPFLTAPIPDNLVAIMSIENIQKQGYKILNPLEKAFYQAQGIMLNRDTAYPETAVQPWYVDCEDSTQGLILNCCVLFTRYGFAGEAQKQLTRIAKYRPELNRLLSINPQWAIDFRIDYLDNKSCTKVIHIQQDFVDYHSAAEAKQQLEQIIESTNWNEAVENLLRKKHKLNNLNFGNQSTARHSFFG